MQFRDRPDFRFLSVSFPAGGETDEDARVKTAVFLKQRNADFPTYIDASGRFSEAVGGALNEAGMSLPTTLIVDRESRIRGVWTGYLPGFEDQMREVLEELLKQ